MADVTDKDRAAAKRFIYDYNVRDIFQSREGPVEDLADQLAQARAEGRREEREAAANRFIASCPCENHDFSPGECETCHWFATGAEAIRARGEKGKD